MEYIDLLAAPFAWGGRGPQTFDCYGLCMELYKRRGIILPEYQSNPDFSVIDDSVNAGIRAWMMKLDQPEPFCLVLFSIRPPFATHIGVVMEDCRRFIHIMRKSRVSVERLADCMWYSKIVGFYRYTP
jgi:cell wall-associated NlpC family hydrolase